jgi:hypothetical protein
MTAHDQPELQPLAERYDITGELYVRNDARTLVAHRRNDGAPVLIVVARPPVGDERHALTHYASDAHVLEKLSHHNLVQVLEGLWLGPDTFALVTERVAAPTLAELLSREELTPPRVARILQDVNGLLEWARSHGVVHRGVTPSTLFLEPGTDRTRASFVVQPIPITGVPGVEGDAKTIASLAWSMVARGAELTGDQPEVEPALPTPIVERTRALLEAEPARDVPPDVQSYISMIAMTDALRQSDALREKVRLDLLEEQRETWDQLHKDREEFAGIVAERERRFAEEREELGRTLAEHRESLEAERTALKEEIEREREALAAERKELEGSIAAEREALAVERAAIEARRAEGEQLLVEIELRRHELELLREATPSAAVAASLEGEEPLVENVPAPVVESIPVPLTAAPSALESAKSPDRFAEPAPIMETSSLAERTRSAEQRPRRWMVPAAAALLIIAVVASGLGLRSRHAQASRSAAVETSPGTITDSAAGGIGARLATPDSVRTKPAIDSQAAPNADSLAALAAAARQRRARRAAALRDSLARADSALVQDTSQSAPVRAVVRSDSAQRDSVARDSARPESARLDSARRNSLLRNTVRRDSVRRDSVRRDSIRRDSLARRDTTTRRQSPARRDSVSKPKPDTLQNR